MPFRLVGWDCGEVGPRHKGARRGGGGGRSVPTDGAGSELLSRVCLAILHTSPSLERTHIDRV